MAQEKIIIAGAGPAGLTAAIYTGRAGLSPLVIEGKQPGGQLMSTTYVENWPGIKRIAGPELMQHMREQAEHCGARFISGTVESTDFSQKNLRLTLDHNRTLQAHAVIVATGSSHKKLGCPGEKEYWNHGVSTCAVCDGALYKDAPVVIVGGGDTAMEEALFMSNLTQDVTVVQIAPELTASNILKNRVLANKKIKIIYNGAVTAIEGDGAHVTHVAVAHSDTGKQTRLPARIVFVAIGLKPNSDPFKSALNLNPYGFIVTKDFVRTSAAGVFAAGDVADCCYRQAITAAGDGCKAALDAERYLHELGI